ncbi:MAG: type IV pilus biogenesis/stability protein PilW [Burkholderiales bacterium]
MTVQTLHGPYMGWQSLVLARRWAMLVLGLLLCLGLLGGCAQKGAGSSDLKDKVTESDEPDNARRARVRLELASAYFERGQMNVALDEVKLALAADPNLGPAFNLRGLIYGSMGEHALAEDSFRRALQINPRDVDTMQNWGWYLCQRQRHAEADNLFRQALVSPQNQQVSRTLLTQGICQARAGDLSAAEATLQRAFEIDAGNPSIAVNLAEVLYRRGDFERARFQMRRINAVREIANPQTLWLAMRIERKLGNAQGVATLGQQLRDRFPESPQAKLYASERFDE